jgi:RHS repeat-associated protein
MELNKGATSVTATFLPDRTGGVAALASEDASGNLNWNLPNQVGSVQDVVNNAGVFSDRLLFNAEGQKTENDSAPSAASIYGFQGEQQPVSNTPSGIFALDRNGLSWTDPALQNAFISPDPKGFAVGTNAYERDGNNPVNNIDPTGLEFQTGVSAGPVPWSGPISAPNLSPQAGSFSTGQTPLQQVPGTAYTPFWRQIAQAAASSPAPAQGPTTSQLVDQLLNEAKIPDTSPSAASIVASDTAAYNQQLAAAQAAGAQEAANYNPDIGWNEQAAQYAAEDQGQAQVIELNQQEEQQQYSLSYQVNQFESGLTAAVSDVTGALPETVRLVSSVVGNGLLLGASILQPELFAEEFGGEAAFGGANLYTSLGGSADVFGGANLFTSPELAGAAYTPIEAEAGLSTAPLSSLGEGVVDNRLPIQEGEITTYQDFMNRSVVGDNLEGHELWQNANLKAQGLAPARLSTLASRNNPIIALDQPIHAQLTIAQQAFDAASQAPIENINTNATLMRLLDAAPEDAVTQLQQLATEHAKRLGY